MASTHQRRADVGHHGAVTVDLDGRAVDVDGMNTTDVAQ
jgi:hypothetical protein